MYRACSLDEVKSFMEKTPERYFDELEELIDLEEEDGTEAYCSEDCYLLLSRGRRRTRFLAMPVKPDFDLGALEAFLHKKAEHFILQLNAEGTEKLRFSEPYDQKGPVASYWADADVTMKTKKKPRGKIRVLTPADERRLSGFTRTDGAMVSFPQLFRELVIDEIGTMLGFFDEDGDFEGYASFMPTELDIPVLDDLYVKPSARRQGIGTALAKAVLCEALGEDGEYCYWAAAESEAARKTAEAAGFRKVAERMTLETF